MREETARKIKKLKELIILHVNYPQFRRELIELLEEITTELEDDKNQCGGDCQCQR
jgi:hypothetical protein